MVARVGVQKAQGFAPRGLVNDLIDSWQWEGVLGTRLVEACAINTHPALPAFLLDKHRVCEPLRVLDFLDETRCEELGDLLSDCSTLLLVKASQVLLHELGTRLNVKGVLGDLPRDAQQLLFGKDIPVGAEEVGERASLFVSQRGADLNYLGWILWVNLDCLRILRGFEGTRG